MPDALPATTLALYPGLEQAPNMLACIRSGAVNWMGSKEKVDGVGIFVAQKWLDSVVSVERHSDGAQMAIFGDFFASCIFSEPRAARFRSAS